MTGPGMSELEGLRSKLDRVRGIHRKTYVDVVTCDEECDEHADGDCPVSVYAVCEGCYDLCVTVYPYAFESGGIADVAWPCETARALEQIEVAE